MIELDKQLVTQWTQSKENQARMPIYIKVNCPSCGTSLVGFKIGFSQLYNDEIFHARAHCMACGAPAHLFMVNWMPKNDPDSRNARLYIDPSPMIDLGLSKDIDFQAISPRFVTIYEQAMRAAQMGYDELVGMGYRKALEFLIKDYLIGKQTYDIEFALAFASAFPYTVYMDGDSGSTKTTSEKSVSLFPLEFREALRALLATPPLKKKRLTKTKKLPKRTAEDGS